MLPPLIWTSLPRTPNFPRIPTHSGLTREGPTDVGKSITRYAPSVCTLAELALDVALVVKSCASFLVAPLEALLRESEKPHRRRAGLEQARWAT